MSKDDSANVHWRGTMLSDSVFVHTAISWDPKVQGLKRIQTSLDLKMKGFVLIDGREDELELMRTMYPEIPCLDVTNPNIWTRAVGVRHRHVLAGRRRVAAGGIGGGMMRRVAHFDRPAIDEKTGIPLYQIKRAHVFP
jgi:hypothetical protein